MTLSHTAQGLASLGRGNDSMLVHMTPREVQGLQGLAMAHGGSLTINPQTGLPEAGFLDSILPTVAGFGLNALFPGLGALGTGLLVGGVTALASGDLGKGVMAGFGAGSGAGLGSTFAKMGKSAVGGISGNQAVGAVGKDIISQLPENVAQNAATNLGMFNSAGATPFMGAAGTTVPTISQAASTLGDATSNLGMFNTGATGATAALSPSASQIAQSQLSQPSLLGDASSRLGEMSEGFKTFAKDPFDTGYQAFKDAGGSTMDLLSPVASVGMEALKPKPLDPYVDPDTGKYRSSTGGLSLSDKFDTGLRLVAKGGYIKGYALGGAVNPNPPEGGGLSDLYNRPEGQISAPISSNAYGLGRLSNLGSEQARYQAQTLGYDEGGSVSSSDSASADTAADSTAIDYSGIHPLNAAALGLYPGSSLASTSTPTPTPEYVGGMPSPSYVESMGYRGGMPTSGLMESIGYRGGMPTSGLMESMGYRGGMPTKYDYLTGIGGVSRRRDEFGFVKGGYLNGDGDGMSDSIPATIEGKQPARLADGEFVIPADVVSHLGNGSSKAGSKRLYAMLDKVRQARTGNKKQGKEIKAEKYLPA